MARTTLQNTLTELFALLADTDGNPVASLASAGCVKVYPHEPGASGVAGPCSVTIHPSGIEPTDWLVAVRVYVKDNTPEVAQDLLIDVPVTVSELLKAGQGYGPDSWQMEAVELPSGLVWVAVNMLMVGRQDDF